MSSEQINRQNARAAPWKLGPLLRYGLAMILSLLALWLSLLLQVPFGNPFWFFFAIARTCAPLSR